MVLNSMKESEIIFVRGLNYHVRHWGKSGQPLVFLLHGWMDMSATFQFFVDACQHEWHFIAPDWRGFGKSEGNAAPYWFPDYLGDLEALLDYYTPDAPAAIVGHSMGGNIACLYGGIRPDRVSHLVTLEGFGLAPSHPNEAPERYRLWLNELKSPPQQSHYNTLEDMATRLQQANSRLGRGQALFLAEHFSRPTRSGELEWAADAWHRGVNPILYQLEEAKAIWRHVTAPILWVGAKESFVMNLFHKHAANYAERKACFRHLTEVLLDDAGHNLHHDQPVKLAGLVETFLSSGRV